MDAETGYISSAATVNMPAEGLTSFPETIFRPGKKNQDRSLIDTDGPEIFIGNRNKYNNSNGFITVEICPYRLFLGLGLRPKWVPSAGGVNVFNGSGAFVEPRFSTLLVRPCGSLSPRF